MRWIGAFDFVNECILGLTESRDWFKVLDVLLIDPMGPMMYTFYISIYTKADKKEEKSINAENIYLGVGCSENKKNMVMVVIFSFFSSNFKPNILF